MPGINHHTDFTVAHFSGGRSSAVMLKMMIDAGSPPDVAVFSNTGMETPETLQFVAAVKEHIVDPAGVPFHIIEFGRGADGGAVCREVDVAAADQRGAVFLEMVRYTGNMPNQRMRSCTKTMKIETCARFISKRYGRNGFLSAFGIRADEQRRVAAHRRANDRLEAHFNEGKKVTAMRETLRVLPLADAGVTRAGVVAEIAGWGEWADVAKGGARLSNCVGCFNISGVNEKVNAFRDHPQKAAAWLEAERIVQALHRERGDVRREYPVKLHATHLRHFNRELPPDMRDLWTSDENWSWRQYAMLAEGKGETLLNPDGDATKHGDCMSGYCGADI